MHRTLDLIAAHLSKFIAKNTFTTIKLDRKRNIFMLNDVSNNINLDTFIYSDCFIHYLKHCLKTK